ncbi:MAG: radical SAM family heme chaperone HemW [Lautropia sp.]
MTVRLVPRPTRAGLRALPPLGLYVHLPWCLRKCPYCDFNSHEFAAGQDPIALERAYLDALERDLEASLPLVWGRPVETVFIGGGTPSLFSGASIERLLATVRALLPLVPDAEVTMEANPGTFERARFAEFRAAGVNRLSLGVQSFDDASLERIGRVHDGAQARAAAAFAAATFDTFNLDLMYALPGQTPAQLAEDLRIACSYAPPHLSCYHLTIEPNTLFARHPPNVPDDDTAHAMQDAVGEALSIAGLRQYEVSAWARDGHRCRHNLNYWSFGDYLGIGAGAHGKLSFHDRIVRHARYRAPARYQASLPPDAQRTGPLEPGAAVEVVRELDAADLGFEFMLNSLRLVDGVETGLFEARTGVSIAAISPALREAVARGLLTEDPARLAATPLGMRFLNDLQQLFLPD